MQDIYYKEPVFRPPSEAYSLLIQLTEGCTHKCTFCVSNHGKKYLVRDVKDIKKDLDIAKNLYGSSVKRIFFLDGNALSAPFEVLHEVILHAKKNFPGLERVGMYACGEDILKKSKEELTTLSKDGLKIVYVGLESGDDEILKEINKRITSAELIAAAKKAMEANITFSGTVILGIAGSNQEKSRMHAIHTAEMINKMNPDEKKKWYIAALTLMIPPFTLIKKKYESGDFQPMNNIQILRELKLMLENIDDNLHDCIFRSNHASNYLVLKGVLAQDKKILLDKVKNAINNPDVYLRPEFYRAL
ncbi:MAG: radical SAM protein [Promethearchaeota archaeon]